MVKDDDILFEIFSKDICPPEAVVIKTIDKIQKQISKSKKRFIRLAMLSILLNLITFFVLTVYLILAPQGILAKCLVAGIYLFLTNLFILIVCVFMDEIKQFHINNNY